MSNTPRNLTRNQLAEFLPNARAIRAFEQVLKNVSNILPADLAVINRLLQELTIDSGSASSAAQTALDSLVALEQSLSLDIGAADGKASEALTELANAVRILSLLATAPLTHAHNSTATDYIDLNPNAPTASESVGRLKWGPTGTLELSMGGGNIIQQVGEEIFVYGKASAAITNGQLIMVTGSVGASGVLTFAPTAIGLTDPNAILGVATEDLALNAFGRVTVLGIVHGINTTGASVGEVWADGDILWYNPGFVGGMTKVKPAAPNMKTQVAIVINASGGGSGSLQVEVLHGSTLGGTDSNVQLGALADKQLLQYDSAAGYWKNVAVSIVGSTAAETHAAASKVTPVDADEIPLADSASSFSLKKLTWANLKATLATWIGGNLIAGSFTSLVSSTTGKVATTLGVGNATPSASGAGISFPAAQSASTDANTLDDYEEGTWTPAFTVSAGGSATFTLLEAKYTKIGRLVFCMLSAARNDASALAGAVTWSLPFPSDGTSNWFPCGVYSLNGVSNSGVVLIDNYANNIANGHNTAAAADLNYAVLANTYRLNVSMTYMTA